MGESTFKQFQRVEDTFTVVHEDLKGRFADNTALLSIGVRYDRDKGYHDVFFLADGNSEVLYMGIADVMERYPELIMLLQRSVMVGNTEEILGNLDNYIEGLQPPSDDDFGDDWD